LHLTPPTNSMLKSGGPHQRSVGQQCASSTGAVKPCRCNHASHCLRGASEAAKSPRRNPGRARRRSSKHGSCAAAVARPDPASYRSLAPEQLRSVAQVLFVPAVTAAEQRRASSRMAVAGAPPVSRMSTSLKTYSPLVTKGPNKYAADGLTGLEANRSKPDPGAPVTGIGGRRPVDRKPAPGSRSSELPARPERA